MRTPLRARPEQRGTKVRANASNATSLAALIRRTTMPDGVTLCALIGIGVLWVVVVVLAAL